MAAAQAGALAGATSALAQPADTVTTVYACVKAYGPSQGRPRILGTGVAVCYIDETLILWNIEGPEGQTGPRGLQGSIGPQGPKGDTGPQGPQG
ncbi:hypothetical protein FHR32_000554 [Streptosporangium album]|uniref:Collagen-like protein n=1 Tax=Streptosporangium album TaxID=47479 RepID=A0A7W7RQD4_9ACTN|nr:hypothetical protein [Streptosporangium album]